MNRMARILRAAPWRVDTRSLALTRIALALLLLVDLVGRLPDLALFYSDDGILPAHTLLLAEPTRVHLSYLLTTSRVVEVQAFFALAAGVYLALLVGWQTRLFQVLALLASVSLHARNPMVLHAGDLLLDVTLAWTLLLPLGRHLSLDAHLRPASARPPPTTVRSLAALGLSVELCAVFVLGVLNRTDPAWSDGSAFRILLGEDAIARIPALWLRTHAGPGALAALGQGWNALELVAGLGLLIPGRARRVAAGLIVLDLLALSLLLNLGQLPLVVFAALPMVVGPTTWRQLTAGLADRAPALARTLQEPLERPRTTRADLFEGTIRELLAASLLATSLASFMAYNDGLPPSLRHPAPSWTRPWNDALGVTHRWALFGGELPREDEHLVLVAHTASGAAVDLLTGEPARLELGLARGSTRRADRIALDLHLLAGWLDTVRLDLEGYARRAHELPGSGITSPVTRVQAVRLHRPIVPGGRLPPPRAEVLFDNPIDRSTPPSDVLLPALAEPFARVPTPPPDPAIQRVATPLAFDLLKAPRVIEIEGTLDGEPVRLALDSTAPVSVVDPAWFGLPPGDILPIPLGELAVADNLYLGLVAFPGHLDDELTDRHIAGVLGQDFLALHDVDLDLAARRLTLHPAGTAGTVRLPLDDLVQAAGARTPAGARAVPIRVDDRVEGLGIFEFHAPIVRINGALLGGFGMKVTDMSLRLRHDHQGRRHFIRVLRLAKLAAGPIFARDRMATVSDSRLFDALGLTHTPSALLGLESFPAARVVFTHGEGPIYLGASPSSLRRPPAPGATSPSAG